MIPVDHHTEPNLKDGFRIASSSTASITCRRYGHIMVPWGSKTKPEKCEWSVIVSVSKGWNEATTKVWSSVVGIKRMMRNEYHSLMQLKSLII